MQAIILWFVYARRNSYYLSMPEGKQGPGQTTCLKCLAVQMICWPDWCWESTSSILWLHQECRKMNRNSLQSTLRRLLAMWLTARHATRKYAVTKTSATFRILKMWIDLWTWQNHWYLPVCRLLRLDSWVKLPQNCSSCTVPGAPQRCQVHLHYVAVMISLILDCIAFCVDWINVSFAIDSF